MEVNHLWEVGVQILKKSLENLEVHGSQWKSSEVHRRLLKSSEVYDSRWKSMEILRSPWKSVEIFFIFPSLICGQGSYHKYL